MVQWPIYSRVVNKKVSIQTIMATSHMCERMPLLLRSHVRARASMCVVLVCVPQQAEGRRLADCRVSVV